MDFGQVFVHMECEYYTRQAFKKKRHLTCFTLHYQRFQLKILLFSVGVVFYLNP